MFILTINLVHKYIFKFEVDVCDLNKFIGNQFKTKFVFMIGEEDTIKIEIKVIFHSNY